MTFFTVFHCPVWVIGVNLSVPIYCQVCTRLGVVTRAASTKLPTYIVGLVQEYDHMFLPNVAPFATAALTLSCSLPLAILIKKGRFVELLCLCAFTSYLFGWHVHEKAIVLINVPYTVLALQDRRHAANFLMTTAIGSSSLFPLFFTEFESPIKYLLSVSYFFAAVYGLANAHANWTQPVSWRDAFNSKDNRFVQDNETK